MNIEVKPLSDLSIAKHAIMKPIQQISDKLVFLKMH